MKEIERKIETQEEERRRWKSSWKEVTGKEEKDDIEHEYEISE